MAKGYRSVAKKIVSIEYTDMKLENLYVFLAIYLLFVSAAFGTVFVERIIYQKARAPNKTQFWRYAEMIIDPYRYFYLRDFEWGKYTFFEGIFMSIERKRSESKYV